NGISRTEPACCQADSTARERQDWRSTYFQPIDSGSGLARQDRPLGTGCQRAQQVASFLRPDAFQRLHRPDLAAALGSAGAALFQDALELPSGFRGWLLLDGLPEQGLRPVGDGLQARGGLLALGEGVRVQVAHELCDGPLVDRRGGTEAAAEERLGSRGP